MPSSPWRAYFTLGDQGYLVSLNIHQRLTRIIPDATGRQALWLPVQPLDAVSEVLTLLDPVFAHYAAQWPRIMTGMEEDEFGRGFYLEGEDLPEQIADPSHADELDVIAWRNIPPETRREWEEAWDSIFDCVGDSERDAYQALARNYPLFGLNESNIPYTENHRISSPLIAES